MDRNLRELFQISYEAIGFGIKHSNVVVFVLILMSIGHFLGRLIRSLGVPKERGVWNSQGGRKDKPFFPLHSLGLYNNNVSCLRTVSG